MQRNGNGVHDDGKGNPDLWKDFQRKEHLCKKTDEEKPNGAAFGR